MKRIVILGLALALAAAAQLAAAGFRGSMWADTVDEVRAVETATFHHVAEDELAYTDASVEGISGGIIYLFEDGLLVRGVYVSRDKYEGGDGALADYARLRDYFEGELGKPGEADERWVDDSLRDDPERLAEAIVREHVRLTTRWRLEGTHVELIMSGRDGGIYMRAVFQPSG